jgi:hypothetical protein
MTSYHTYYKYYKEFAKAEEIKSVQQRLREALQRKLAAKQDSMKNREENIVNMVQPPFSQIQNKEDMEISPGREAVEGLTGLSAVKDEKGFPDVKNIEKPTWLKMLEYGFTPEGKLKPSRAHNIFDLSRKKGSKIIGLPDEKVNKEQILHMNEPLIQEFKEKYMPDKDMNAFFDLFLLMPAIQNSKGNITPSTLNTALKELKEEIEIRKPAEEHYKNWLKEREAIREPPIEEPKGGNISQRAFLGPIRSKATGLGKNYPLLEYVLQYKNAPTFESIFSAFDKIYEIKDPLEKGKAIDRLNKALFYMKKVLSDPDIYKEKTLRNMLYNKAKSDIGYKDQLPKNATKEEIEENNKKLRQLESYMAKIDENIENREDTSEQGKAFVEQLIEQAKELFPEEAEQYKEKEIRQNIERSNKPHASIIKELFPLEGATSYSQMIKENTGLDDKTAKSVVRSVKTFTNENLPTAIQILKEIERNGTKIKDVHGSVKFIIPGSKKGEYLAPRLITSTKNKDYIYKKRNGKYGMNSLFVDLGNKKWIFLPIEPIEGNTREEVLNQVPRINYDNLNKKIELFNEHILPKMKDLKTPEAVKAANLAFENIKFLRGKKSNVKNLGLKQEKIEKPVSAKPEVKAKETKSKKPERMIKVSFQPEMKEAILSGNKSMTSRTFEMGVGDVFKLGGQKFKITKVDQHRLRDVANKYYKQEGVDSPEEFVELWKKIHKGKYNPKQVVYTHTFKPVESEAENKKEEPKKQTGPRLSTRRR